MGDLFCLLRIFKLILFMCLFSCRMERGHEEASTSQAGRKRGTPRETPTISSLVTAMCVEDLRSLRQVNAPSDWRCQTT